MLKYNIKTDGSSTNEEIMYDEFYLAPDLSFISGVTDIHYSLVNNEKVNLKVPFYDGLYTTDIKIDNVIRQGYVIYNKPYIIEKLDDTTNYIFYNNGKIYYEGVDGNNFFFINGVKYYRNGNVVNIDTKYWIENSVLKIDGINYDVDLNLTKQNNDDSKPIYNIPYIKINDDVTLTPIDFQYDKWKRVTKFIINKDNDVRLNVDAVTCAEYYRYIVYGDVSYEVNDNNEVNIDGIIYTIAVIDIESKNLIDVDGTLCDIRFGWRGCANGEFLYVYLTDNIKLNQNEHINITSISSTSTRLPIIGNEGDSDRYIIYNGFKYPLQDKIRSVVEIDGKEYIIYHDEKDNTKGYIIISNIQNDITINGDKIKRFVFKEIGGKVDYVEVEEPIIYYSGVTIDDTIYTVLSGNIPYYDGSQDSYFITIDKEVKYEFLIDEYTSPNILRCSLIVGDDMTEEDGTSASGAISSNIFNNFGEYYFTIPNKMFGDSEIVPKSGMGENILDPNAKSDALDIILEDILKIYKIVDYISLPLNFNAEIANNLFQEMTLETDFFNVEKERSINRIVDMEKEIYSPVYITNDTMFQNFPVIDEIIFNLHFRTRDLNTWKIIEDDGTEVNSKRCNWFISDNEFYKNIASDTKFEMSDLLYFLDFTNDDVFFQKSKLSKSFLRLSFYDSYDPKVQSLLHSSTIFLDEGLDYKKYINNIKNGNFISVEKSDKIQESKISIEVNTEPVEGKDIIFDENKRLSCRFTVKNRYEDTKSAEGFYLYMFKEYSNNLHEKSIYLKVEFNHAGIGRTIPFMMPLTEDGEIETNIDNFKKGYPLTDIYKQMFIELKVVYDAVNRKYVYFLPFQQNEAKLTFNLFEIKIKDES